MNPAETYSCLWVGQDARTPKSTDTLAGRVHRTPRQAPTLVRGRQLCPTSAHTLGPRSVIMPAGRGLELSKAFLRFEDPGGYTLLAQYGSLVNKNSLQNAVHQKQGVGSVTRHGHM